MILKYSTPKYRSGSTGTLITREQTEVLQDIFDYDTRLKLVEDGFLIPCGEWPDIVEERPWQELCENGLHGLAVKQYKETHDNCSIREAMKAVDEYCEALKTRYKKV